MALELEVTAQAWAAILNHVNGGAEKPERSHGTDSQRMARNPVASEREERGVLL